MTGAFHFSQKQQQEHKELKERSESVEFECIARRENLLFV